MLHRNDGWVDEAGVATRLRHPGRCASRESAVRSHQRCRSWETFPMGFMRPELQSAMSPETSICAHRYPTPANGIWAGQRRDGPYRCRSGKCLNRTRRIDRLIRPGISVSGRSLVRARFPRPMLAALSLRERERCMDENMWKEAPISVQDITVHSAPELHVCHACGHSAQAFLVRDYLD